MSSLVPRPPARQILISQLESIAPFADRHVASISHYFLLSLVALFLFDVAVLWLQTYPCIIYSFIFTFTIVTPLHSATNAAIAASHTVHRLIVHHRHELSANPSADLSPFSANSDLSLATSAVFYSAKLFH